MKSKPKSTLQPDIFHAGFCHLEWPYIFIQSVRGVPRSHQICLIIRCLHHGPLKTLLMRLKKPNFYLHLPTKLIFL